MAVMEVTWPASILRFGREYFLPDSRHPSASFPIVAYADLSNSGSILGWAGIVRVDGTSYTWLGAPNISGVVPPVVNQTAFSYTSTKSVFQLDVAGLVDMNITFLSAVYPEDYMRQSFPISFLDVSVESRDGSPHDVQVYTDISAGKAAFSLYCSSKQKVSVFELQRRRNDETAKERRTDWYM